MELIDKSDIVTVLCDGLKDELLKTVGLHDCNKLLVIPNCMPPMSKYSYLEKKTKSKITKWRSYFINKWFYAKQCKNNYIYCSKRKKSKYCYKS